MRSATHRVIFISLPRYFSLKMIFADYPSLGIFYPFSGEKCNSAIGFGAFYAENAIHTLHPPDIN